jgi:hypothetical protein
MWETGYAMALDKPTLIVTQSLSEMPFDLKDMQSIEYDRNHLTQSLGQPLKRLVEDTLDHAVQAARDSRQATPESLPGSEASALRAELAELKDMVGQLVKAWNPSSRQTAEEHAADATHQHEQLLTRFEGAWYNAESESYLYARFVNGQLLAPYCYMGNDHLTGVYYGWSRMGEYWFARFSWVSEDIAGFAFVREESSDALVGSWWLDEEFSESPNAPPDISGVSMRIERLRGAQTPTWAERFFDKASREDVVGELKRRRES